MKLSQLLLACSILGGVNLGTGHGLCTPGEVVEGLCLRCICTEDRVMAYCQDTCQDRSTKKVAMNSIALQLHAHPPFSLEVLAERSRMPQNVSTHGPALLQRRCVPGSKIYHPYHPCKLCVCNSHGFVDDCKDICHTMDTSPPYTIPSLMVELRAMDDNKPPTNLPPCFVPTPRERSLDEPENYSEDPAIGNKEIIRPNIQSVKPHSSATTTSSTTTTSTAPTTTTSRITSLTTPTSTTSTSPTSTSPTSTTSTSPTSTTPTSTTSTSPTSTTTTSTTSTSTTSTAPTTTTSRITSLTTPTSTTSTSTTSTTPTSTTSTSTTSTTTTSTTSTSPTSTTPTSTTSTSTTSTTPTSTTSTSTISTTPTSTTSTSTTSTTPSTILSTATTTSTSTTTTSSTSTTTSTSITPATPYAIKGIVSFVTQKKSSSASSTQRSSARRMQQEGVYCEYGNHTLRYNRCHVCFCGLVRKFILCENACTGQEEKCLPGRYERSDKRSICTCGNDSNFVKCASRLQVRSLDHQLQEDENLTSRWFKIVPVV